MVEAGNMGSNTSIIPETSANRINRRNGRSRPYKFPSTRTLLARCALEFLAFIILGYPMLHIYVILQGNWEPYGRGFFCDDENLKHPYKEEAIRY